MTTVDTLPAISPRHDYRIAAKNSSATSQLSGDYSGGIIRAPLTPTLSWCNFNR
jgi:hypothetical protein